MILKHELESLNDDELALLWLIVIDKGSKEVHWEHINCIRKEYLFRYVMQNKSKFNEKGIETSKELLKKLLHVENPISG